MNETNETTNETQPTFRVLSIDAWRYDDGWTWNNWFHVGDVPREVCELTPRRLLRFLRAEGYLGAKSGGKVAIDDDGHNLVIVNRTTREPLYAVEYGVGL